MIDPDGTESLNAFVTVTVNLAAVSAAVPASWVAPTASDTVTIGGPVETTTVIRPVRVSVELAFGSVEMIVPSATLSSDRGR